MGVGGREKARRKKTLIQVDLENELFFPSTILSCSVRSAQSQKRIQKSFDGDRLISISFAGVSDVFLLAEIQQFSTQPDGTLRVIFRGVSRMDADGHLIEDAGEDSLAESIALKRILVEMFEELSSKDSSIPVDWLPEDFHSLSLSDFCDQVSHHLALELDLKRQIFGSLVVKERAQIVLGALRSELEVASWKAAIQLNFESKMDESRKQIYLREQIRVLQSQLEESGNEDALRERIEGRGLPAKVEAAAKSEFKKLQSSTLAGTEEQVVRTYLDTLLEIPWGVKCEETLDLVEAERILRERHLGQEAVKERVLEYLSIRRLQGTRKGDVICFLGPPGVGKTSMAHAIGEALSRPVGHIALGGLRDDAELRGHRRTYVGSRPGRIVQSIRQAGVMNPILILDEIDKLVSNHQGDPMSALLEILDSVHHHSFIDHYLEVPMDLSEVLFIASANSVDEIPEPLLDRMEIIEFSGYTELERVSIARDYMVPQAVTEVGLGDRFPVLRDDAFVSLCREYSRESGVRGLKREIQRLARKLAREFLKVGGLPATLSGPELRKYLGTPFFEDRQSVRESESGTAYGLVVSSYGGDGIAIEVSLHRPVGSSPALTITGGAGKVMEESISTALTCVRALLDQKGVDSRFDVHVHLPQAAIKKDGPSAGVTIATALFSAFTGRKIRGDVAMTGEITLRGRLLPVGGLREKILAADRAGFSIVLYPASQLETVSKIALEVQSEMKCIPIEQLQESFQYSIQTADQAQTVSIL